MNVVKCFAVVVLFLMGVTLPAQNNRLPADANLHGLAAIDDRTAWTCGTKGTIAKTSNGGESWQLFSIPGTQSLDFRDLEVPGPSSVFLLSTGPGTDSRIYKTTNSGTDWTAQFQNSEKGISYVALAFWNLSNGIALGNPIDGHFRILTTEDGGKKWAVLPSDGMPSAMTGECAFAFGGTSLITRGEREAWFVTGGAKKARVFHSLDRGRKWTVQELPIDGGAPTAGAYSIAFRDSKKGIVVGGDSKEPDVTGATAALTNDGGKTWHAVVDELAFSPSAIWAKDHWIVASGTHAVAFSRDGMNWQGRNIDQKARFVLGVTKKGSVWSAGPNGKFGQVQLK